MFSDEPMVLSIGTEVSAKYKGAFCEAKVKKINRSLRFKVIRKLDLKSLILNEDEIKSSQPKVGNTIIYKDKDNESEAVVNKILDQSVYTVVFDDGDEATLKRTSLCLKSGKHFSESESLDKSPLVSPEYFSINPVRRCRRAKQDTFSSLMRKRKQPGIRRKSKDQNESEEDINSKTSKKDQRSKAKLNVDVGKVICVEYADKRGFKTKDVWFPAFVVKVTDDSSSSGRLTKENTVYKVRSFRDDRYYDVYKKDALEFEIESIKKNLAVGSYSADLSEAIKKALKYRETQEFPSNWDNMEEHTANFIEEEDDYSDEEDEDNDDEDVDNFENDDDEDDEENKEEDDSELSDSEIDPEIGEDEDDEMIKERQRLQQKQCENRDMFVAKLYKFMDDRGTPINECPTVNGKELNLYKLYKLVNKIGGLNRVNNMNAWKKIYNTLGLGVSISSGTGHHSSDSDTNVEELKKAYKEYLHPFHELYRKLGPGSVLVDTRSSRIVSRPFRGERKREEEKSRLNSSSSISSNQSLAIGTRKGSLSKSTNPKTIKNNDNVESETVLTSSNKSQQTKEKEKRKKKDADQDIKQEILKPKIESENDDSLIARVSPSVGDEDSEDEDQVLKKEINVGDCVSVLYGRGKQMKVYDAKVIQVNSTGKCTYFVHYYGWSTRYDEWVEKNRITKVHRDKALRRKSGKAKNKGEPLPPNLQTEIFENNTPNETEKGPRARKSSMKNDKDVKDTINESTKRSRSSENKAENNKTTKVISKTLPNNDSDKRTRGLKEDKEKNFVSKSKAEDTVRRRTSSISSQKDSNKKEKMSAKTFEEKSKRIKLSSDSKQKSKISVKKSPSDDESKESFSKREKKKSSEFKEIKEKANKELSIKRDLNVELSKISNESEISVKKKRIEEVDKSKSRSESSDFSESKVKDELMSTPSEAVEDVKLSVKTAQIKQVSHDRVSTENEENSNLTSVPVVQNFSKADKIIPKEPSYHTEKKQNSEEAKNETSDFMDIEKLTKNESVKSKFFNEDTFQTPLFLPALEDLEVESILLKKESNESSDLKGLHHLKKPEKTSKIDNKSEELELDRDSPGMLIVDEDVNNEDDSSKSSKSELVSVVKLEPVPPLKESCDSNNLSAQQPKKAENEPNILDSLLLCQETVPLSPPTSPQNIENLSSPVSIVRDQNDFYKPMIEKNKSNITQDSSLKICHQSTFKSGFDSTFPSCKKMARNVNLESNPDQPFSHLIAAASQSKTGLKPVESTGNSKYKSSNLINEEEIDDDDDDDDDDDEHIDGIDADVDECEDEEDNVNTSDRISFRRTRLFERKRRIHTRNKVNSLSQECSQGGEDHSNDEDSNGALNEDERNNDHKVGSLSKLKPGKRFLSSSSRDRDMKNDDDSSSGSQNQGDKENRNHVFQLPSPRKRRRGRVRTVSQSESSRDLSHLINEFKNRDHSSITKTRGRLRHASGQNNQSDCCSTVSFIGMVENVHNILNESEPFSPDCFAQTNEIHYDLTRSVPQPPDYAVLNSYIPKSKYNFLTPVIGETSEDKANELYARICIMRKTYAEIKRRQAAHERKMRRASRRAKGNDNNGNRKLTDSPSKNKVQSDQEKVANSGSESSSNNNPDSSNENKNENTKIKRQKRDQTISNKNNEPSVSTGFTIKEANA